MEYYLAMKQSKINLLAGKWNWRSFFAKQEKLKKPSVTCFCSCVESMSQMLIIAMKMGHECKRESTKSRKCN
jgi:hypothetical protein